MRFSLDFPFQVRILIMLYPITIFFFVVIVFPYIHLSVCFKMHLTTEWKCALIRNENHLNTKVELKCKRVKCLATILIDILEYSHEIRLCFDPFAGYFECWQSQERKRIAATMILCPWDATTTSVANEGTDATTSCYNWIKRTKSKSLARRLPKWNHQKRYMLHVSR